MARAAASEVNAGRLHLVDALRGIAALAVLVFHLLNNSPQYLIYRRTLPSALSTVLMHGRNGVAIFFVLSGLVITYSLRSTPAEPAALGRFMLRRQVRLDPPYLMLLIIVMGKSIGERFFGSLQSDRFTVRELLTNATYIQYIVGDRPLLDVAWTLCLEIQFYLAFVAFLYLAAIAVKHTASIAIERDTARLTAAFTFALGLVSLGCRAAGVLSTKTWFVDKWSFFCLGSLLALVMTGAVRRWVFFAYVTAAVVGATTFELGFTHGDHWRSEWYGIGTALLLYVAHEHNLLMKGRQRALQFLGRVSYSLYLVHLVVIDTLMSAAYKVTGENVFAALTAGFGGGVASVLAAWAFHRAVEAPANRASARLKSTSLRELLASYRSRRRAAAIEG